MGRGVSEGRKNARFAVARRLTDAQVPEPELCLEMALVCSPPNTTSEQYRVETLNP